jgi:magnesium chelatase family protein
MLMSSPAATGKTLLARAMPSIPPNLSVEEALQITRVYSVSGMLPADEPLTPERPVRARHHTISCASGTLVRRALW